MPVLLLFVENAQKEEDQTNKGSKIEEDASRVEEPSDKESTCHNKDHGMLCYSFCF